MIADRFLIDFLIEIMIFDRFKRVAIAHANGPFAWRSFSNENYDAAMSRCIQVSFVNVFVDFQILKVAVRLFWLAQSLRWGTPRSCWTIVFASYMLKGFPTFASYGNTIGDAGVHGLRAHKTNIFL